MDVLIVGGGVIGASIAWALASRGVTGIVVVDLDLAGVYASSELNAGGVRATWWQPVNIQSCRATLDFFRDQAVNFGFRDRGYLWLHSDPELYAQAIEKRRFQNDCGLGVELLSTDELPERFPILDRGLEEIVGATFSPRDGCRPGRSDDERLRLHPKLRSSTKRSVTMHRGSSRPRHRKCASLRPACRSVRDGWSESPAPYRPHP